MAAAGLTRKVTWRSYTRVGNLLSVVTSCAHRAALREIAKFLVFTRQSTIIVHSDNKFFYHIIVQLYWRHSHSYEILYFFEIHIYHFCVGGPQAVKI